MATRVKVFTTANTSNVFSTLPSFDALVDIDSVQTVSNKILVNDSVTIAGGGTNTVTLENLSRYFFLSLKAQMLGCGWSMASMLGVSPGLSNAINTALATQ